MNPKPKIICPICKDEVDKLLYRFHIEGERMVLEKIKSEHPSWTLNDGLCSRCVDYYHVEIVCAQRIIPSIGPHFPVKSADDFVILPIGLRLGADQRYTGKGITLCFIDSGFYPHADLIASSNRIKKYIDITTGSEEFLLEKTDQSSAWHGTMTTVVGAGDGYSSKGLYKGIASQAELVLLKVQNSEGRITTKNIVKALKWVLEHHKEYAIRIVNLSLRDDILGSYKESEVDTLAETLIGEGVNVVAAVGNDENSMIHPPANSLHVIAVGGIDDENKLFNEHYASYHSTYGITLDELMKPELVAHAIWISAPILPKTFEKEEAEFLYKLVSEFNNSWLEELKKDKVKRDELILNLTKTKLPESILNLNKEEDFREMIIQRIQAAKYISPDYMHVDGTSFAAPIVSSVIAQLLEANSELSPIQIRHILFSSAKRIPDIPVERQGYGIIQPKKALYKILKRKSFMDIRQSPYINREENVMVFFFHSDTSEHISIAGDFNHWAKDILLLEPGRDGLWKISLPILPHGKYLYKFYIDERIWSEDIDNPYREPDGFGGFNSVLVI